VRRLPAAASLILTVATPGSAAEWAVGWYAAPFPAIKILRADDVRTFSGQTVTQTLRVATAAKRLRVRLTNELGTAPVSFAGATIRSSSGARTLRFSGAPGAVIPGGAPLVSDPIDLPVRALEHVDITIRYSAPATPAAHLLPVQVEGSSDLKRGPALASAVEVERAHSAPVIVAFGDSITEGAGATPGETGWPEQLARRFAKDPARVGWTVVNSGISGNRLLRDGAGANALARFDRDALSIAGVTHVVLLEGINDIGWGTQGKPGEQVTAGDIIGAYRQLIARAHGRGIRIIGATLTPYRGAIYYNGEGEKVRETVNQWIRTSGAFDGVIDFAAAVADRTDATAIAGDKQPGDHLHPNVAGYAAMAAAIDPRLFVRPTLK
jgi:lysophospholipase L1-like esterase